MICPKCGKKFSRLKISWTETNNDLSGFNCPKCGVHLKIKNLKEHRLALMRFFPLFLTSFVVFFAAYQLYFNKHYPNTFLILYFPVTLALIVFFQEKSLGDTELVITDEEPRPASEVVVKLEAEEDKDPEIRETKRDMVAGSLQFMIATLFIYIVRVVTPQTATVRIMAYIWIFLAVLQLVVALIFAVARKARLAAIIGIIVYNLFIIIITAILTVKSLNF